jgi:hypothetical protein
MTAGIPLLAGLAYCRQHAWQCGFGRALLGLREKRPGVPGGTGGTEPLPQTWHWSQVQMGLNRAVASTPYGSSHAQAKILFWLGLGQAVLSDMDTRA